MDTDEHGFLGLVGELKGLGYYFGKGGFYACDGDDGSGRGGGVGDAGDCVAEGGRGGGE